MATPDPLEKTFSSFPSSVSKREFAIAGIITTVFGLDELPDFKELSCLWLLHPRLSTRERMEPIAVAAITEWNAQVRKGQANRGLICVSFDQRNHGTRLVNGTSNEAWRNGNPRHAQDMFSGFAGTAGDTSLLINYLPAYIFPQDEHTITSHMVLGVSLGGHAAWHCILHDHRITTAVIVIGCADYVRLMSHRADKSKLDTWRSSNPPGSKFLGSKDFPKALVESVGRLDPAGLLIGQIQSEPSEVEKKRLMGLIAKHLQGKRIFNLAGGADKLVPYSASEPFLQWLKRAIGPSGWFPDRGVYLKDKVYDGVAHEMTPSMMKDSIDFIVETLVGDKASFAKI